MNQQEMGNSRVVFMAFIAVIGAGALSFFPDFVPGVWKILAWAMVVGAVIAAFVFHNNEKKLQKLEEKKKQRQIQERNKRRRDYKKEQEEKIEKTKEKLEKQEERQDEKRAKVKAHIIEEAKEAWSGREGYAKEQEQAIRQSITKTDHMPIRVAAGEVAVEWNEASSLAQWTMKQVEMFSRLPNATKAAREEAQDAIVEAIKIKESGAQWTFEKGKELAEKKERARMEAKAEEDRIDNMRSTLENAALKWKAAERRIERLKGELDKHVASYNRLKK